MKGQELRERHAILFERLKRTQTISFWERNSAELEPLFIKREGEEILEESLKVNNLLNKKIAIIMLVSLVLISVIGWLLFRNKK